MRQTRLLARQDLFVYFLSRASANLDKLHAVITDTKLDQKFAKELTKKGIKVIKA